MYKIGAIGDRDSVLGFSALLLWGRPRMSPAVFSLLHLAYLFACLVYFFMFILLGAFINPACSLYPIRKENARRKYVRLVA